VSQWLDDIWRVSSDAPVSFFLGGLVGIWLASRYRVIKRKRKQCKEDTNGDTS